MISFSEILESKKEVFSFVRALCEREPCIQRVLLFGSRARGDHHERSDFDFAFEAPEISDGAWARFALELRENVPTLCGIDLVRLNGKDTQIAGKLFEKIKQEGVEIYVRK